MARKTQTVMAAAGKGEEVLSGGNGHREKTRGANPWSADFGPIPSNDIDTILNAPDTSDMAGVFARANFRSDEERIAYLRITRRLEKYGLTSRLEFIRQCALSTLGMKAFGTTLQLQTKVELIAPAVIREQLSMKQIKGEEHIRKSDFRQETDDREPRG